MEIIIAINANDIEKNKVRGDLGITYDEDVLRLLDIFRAHGLRHGWRRHHPLREPAHLPQAFRQTPGQSLGIKSYLHYPIAGYPYDIGTHRFAMTASAKTSSWRPRARSSW